MATSAADVVVIVYNALPAEEEPDEVFERLHQVRRIGVTPAMNRSWRATVAGLAERLNAE